MFQWKNWTPLSPCSHSTYTVLNSANSAWSASLYYVGSLLGSVWTYIPRVNIGNELNHRRSIYVVGPTTFLQFYKVILQGLLHIGLSVSHLKPLSQNCNRFLSKHRVSFVRRFVWVSGVVIFLFPIFSLPWCTREDKSCWSSWEDSFVWLPGTLTTVLRRKYVFIDCLHYLWIHCNVKRFFSVNRRENSKLCTWE